MLLFPLLLVLGVPLRSAVLGIGEPGNTRPQSRSLDAVETPVGKGLGRSGMELPEGNASLDHVMADHPLWVSEGVNSNRDATSELCLSNGGIDPAEGVTGEPDPGLDMHLIGRSFADLRLGPDEEEGSDDLAGGVDTARSAAGESGSSLELSIERVIHSIRNPDPTPDMTKEEEDQKWAEMAGPIRSDRSPSSGRKQEGTGETVEAANDGSARPNRGATDGSDIWEGYSDVEPARSSGDDGPVETSGAGRFGDGVGVDRVGECGPDCSVEDASPDQGVEIGRGRSRWMPRRQLHVSEGQNRFRTRTHSNHRSNGKRRKRRGKLLSDG
jgi:hypothetical protein